jgi:hypothetical protein
VSSSAIGAGAGTGAGVCTCSGAGSGTCTAALASTESRLLHELAARLVRTIYKWTVREVSTKEIDIEQLMI